MTTQTRNEVLLEGIALEAPALSHENHGTRFYRFPLQVPRLSGTPDTLPVLVPEALLTAVRLEDPLRVRGQLRSFNNRSGVGNRDFFSCAHVSDGSEKTIVPQTTLPHIGDMAEGRSHE